MSEVIYTYQSKSPRSGTGGPRSIILDLDECDLLNILFCEYFRKILIVKMNKCVFSNIDC
jgi:hypothetical protein